MNTIKQATNIWKSFRKELMPTQPEFNSIEAKDLIGNLFCPGPWYSYILQINEGHFSYMHPNAREFYGKEETEIVIDDLIDRIHPDCHPFFLKCETLVAAFLTEKIDPSQIFQYKFVYSYPFRDPNGKYRHLLHQCIAFVRGEKGNMTASFGVHSFIDHLSEKSNNKLSIIGMDGSPSYWGIDIFNAQEPLQLMHNPFSQREVEIIRLTSMGQSSKEIASALYLSHDTVRTHRQNILNKVRMPEHRRIGSQMFSAEHIIVLKILHLQYCSG